MSFYLSMLISFLISQTCEILQSAYGTCTVFMIILPDREDLKLIEGGAGSCFFYGREVDFNFFLRGRGVENYIYLKGKV